MRTADGRWATFSLPTKSAFIFKVDGTLAGLRLALWELWLEIAERHAAVAAECRQSDDELDLTAAVLHGEAPRPCPEPRLVGGFGEVHHTIIAVAAASHALDGLYGTVKSFVTSPRFSDAPRHRQILETLKVGFRIAGSKAEAWREELEWLFDLRDSIVHHADEYRPVRPVRETERTVVFGGVELFNLSAVTASRASNLAREVVNTCIANPKPATANWVKGWANWEPGPAGTITPDDLTSWLFPIRGHDDEGSA